MQDTEELLVEEAPLHPIAPTARTWSRPLVLTGTLMGFAVVATFASKGFSTKPDAAAIRDKAAFSATYVASQTCYGFTGGHCAMSDCTKSRGATCQSGKCICEAGCAGADGACHLGAANEIIATDFTLTNAKWTKYSMYYQGVSAFGQLKTTNAFSFLNMGKDKFSLYKMPGNETASRFFVGSVAYPEEVAYIGSTAGTAISGHGLYAGDLTDGKGPDKLSCSVCYDKSKKAIMIGNQAGTYWAYVHHASWLVYASSAARNKVGDGGLWKPNPEFTDSQIAMLSAC